MARYQQPVLNISASDMWAAACAAQRINGVYAKETSDTITETNRTMMTRFITEQSSITAADREQGEVVRKYYKGLTFKILKGEKLSDFDNTAMLIANREVITSNYDLAVAASLPSCYARGTKRDQMNNRVAQCNGGFVGTIGNKVTLTVEIVKVIFSQQWNTFYATGITSDDQAVFFSFRSQLEVGKTIQITGTVKAHRDNSTQLNRVKVKA